MSDIEARSRSSRGGDTLDDSSSGGSMSGGPLVPASAVRVGPDSTHASPQQLSSFIGPSGLD